ncbi:MAG TPA: menaquinone biosynthesis decarboxylase [Armatimonadetes bacterium]|nr:menaquinone biosynthesis decarboxylase [Armatimonadota bacterium]
MSYDTLQDFVAELERRGELKRIARPVDPVLEITEIACRVVKAGGPALLFEQPKGSEVPVLINLFGSERRMALALGVERVEEVAEEIAALLKPEVPPTWGGKLRRLGQIISHARHLQPQLVKAGVCQEVVHTDGADLLEFPILQCWPQDGGRFITLPVVFTKHPVTGQRNVGVYRMQVYDGKTTGMHWHLHKGGSHQYQDYETLNRRMEVAVALGGDPAIIYAATAPLPLNVDELLLAGFLRRRRVELVKCKTVDLEVPAGAEIVLEGYVEPHERRLEGPFGDHTGFYSPPEEYPVFHLTAITHRRNPLYPAIVVGRPPMEDTFLGKATERIFLPLIKLTLPEIVDLNLPLEGVFHNCVMVSIDKRYPGHARKVCYALWGLGQMMFAKFIIVVDKQVNVRDEAEVLFYLWNNVDPRRDTFLVDGPVDALDHSAPRPRYGSKMGIDATRKWPEEGHDRPWPEEIRMSEEVRQRVEEMWGELGL